MQPAQDNELAQTFDTEGAETVGGKLAELNGIANKDEVEKKKSTRSTDSEVTEAYFLFQLYVPNSSNSNYIKPCILIVLCNLALRN